MRFLFAALLVAAGLFTAAPPATAQQIEPPPAEFTPRSPGKAVLLSLVLPGLGHRYVHDGSWRGAATFFALADAAFWLGLAGSEWRHDEVIDSYRALAASRADAQLDGKDRRFFLNLGTFMSSDDFLEAQLRNRNWDQVDYVSDPAFQWQWASEEDFRAYRDLRDDADTWSRRRTVFLSLAPPPPASDAPVLHLRVRW